MSSEKLSRFIPWVGCDVDGGYLEMKPSPSGEWCEAGDVEKLEQRIEELEAQIRKMRSYLEPSRADLHLLCEKADSKFNYRDAMGRLATQQIVSGALQAYREVTDEQ